MDPTQIPSMWREELYHPFLSHAPITLVPLALLLRVSSLIARSPRWEFLLPSSRLIVLLACLSAWIAVYTGGIAEDVVNRVICDPTITHEHEDFAEWTTYIVTLIAVFDLVSLKIREPRKLWNWATAIGLVLATVLMVKAGHLGASLVYQQGAGVYHPTPECREFE